MPLSRLIKRRMALNLKSNFMETDMKKIFYIIAFATLILTGCSKEPQTGSPASVICGEWKSLASETEAAIYLAFSADGTFELYQNLKGNGYEIFRGKWSLEGNVLSGEYNDGEKWTYSYTFLHWDKFMSLTTIDDESLVFEFVQSEIPDVIKETGNVIVKSAY